MNIAPTATGFLAANSRLGKKFLDGRRHREFRLASRKRLRGSDRSIRQRRRRHWIGENIDSNGDGTIDHETRFAYDGNQIVLQFEKDGSGAVTDLTHRYLDAVDQLMADEQVTTPSAAGNVVWPLGDNLGTVRDLATYQSGVTSVANHRVFDSYGNLKSQTNAAVDCLFGFTGLPFDKGSGTYRSATRPYEPATGRWLGKDWIIFGGGQTNLYVYCGNSPTNSRDPAGEAWYDYINPFYWFSVDWSKSVDQEMEYVKELNRLFGTNHTRLDAFTPAERAQIENKLGQTINWGGGAIKASEQELKIRRKVLGTSEGFLWAAAVTDVAAGGLAGAGMVGPAGAAARAAALRITFGHGARHLVGTALSAAQVEAAIIQQITAAGAGVGAYWGWIQVNGQWIQYRVYVLIDGTINVGTYFPVSGPFGR